MSRYEVRHPDVDTPHPQFDTWEEALAAQVRWNKEVSGHKARKIPASEIPIEFECIKCGDTYTDWPNQKPGECFDCFAARELAGKEF